MSGLTLDEYKKIDEDILMICMDYIGNNTAVELLIKDIPSVMMVNGDTGIELVIHEGPADLSKINSNELSKLFGKQLSFMMFGATHMEMLAKILLSKAVEIRAKQNKDVHATPN